MVTDNDQSALDYHRYPHPGKLAITATKPLANQRDLALAYSPGVAAACREIIKDEKTAYDYTSRGNLVAVISNGTAVLGLGNIGSLASKPVMEGKAVLFKQFADIDVFDIEVNAQDPQDFIDTVARLEPTFGGINLEDIKAPECFIIEKALRARMKIPVFHDDQHGTAIIVAAAIFNGLRVVNKKLSDIHLVTAGAGAAALACVDLLVAMGLPKEHVILTDIAGVVYQGRTEEMDEFKGRYAVDTDKRTLQDALVGTDVFLGLSAAGVLKPEWLPSMATSPIIMALANPVPEIMPDLAYEQRPDAIIATGRSDFPNQVNNVLCFPFIFRGALDCLASEINEEMKIACVKAIADLAMVEPPDTVRQAYGGNRLAFGRDYIIPKPFDPRLMSAIAPAVVKAAMESGVATRKIDDLKAYRESLMQRANPSAMVMKAVFEEARKINRKVVFAEGEHERIHRVASQMIAESIATPILIGRRNVILERLKTEGIQTLADKELIIVDPTDNAKIDQHCVAFYQQVKRRGYSPEEVRKYMRNDPTVLAATMVRCGDADAMICGVVGRFDRHLKHVEEAIGTAPEAHQLTAMNVIMLDSGPIFIADTFIQDEPSADMLVDITRLCAAEIRRFSFTPRVALVSYSNFGSHDSASAKKMQRALALLREQEPELEVEGEMQANLAFDQITRGALFPESRLTGTANLLIMPNRDAANIAFNLLKTLTNSTSLGPILLGTAYAAHIITPSTSERELLNMVALAALEAGTSSETR